MIEIESINGTFSKDKLSLIETKGETDTFILSMITAIAIYKKSMTNRVKDRILIIAPIGFASKLNKRATPLIETCRQLGIKIMDKYINVHQPILSIIEPTDKERQIELQTTVHWSNLIKLLKTFDTIIFASIYPLIFTEREDIRKSITLTKGVDKFLNGVAYRENITFIAIENNPLVINTLTETRKTDTYKFEQINKVELILKSQNEDGDIHICLENKLPAVTKGEYKTTLRSIQETKMRDLPHCPTGYAELDNCLDGGFEMGQIVSILSFSENNLTQIAIDLAIKTPFNFKTLIILLSINIRQLKNILSQDENRYEILKNKGNDSAKVLTIDQLKKEGEISEIIKQIENHYTQDDTRIFIIDNDSLISSTSNISIDPNKELDSIYKRLKILALRLDILIIVNTLKIKNLNIKKDSPGIDIDNSTFAMNYVGTQIVVSKDKKIFVSKKRELLNYKKAVLEPKVHSRSYLPFFAK